MSIVHPNMSYLPSSDEWAHSLLVVPPSSSIVVSQSYFQGHPRTQPNVPTILPLWGL